MGIDYGNGMTNIDLSNGIRYGVISCREVPYYYEEAEAYYGKPHCPECGAELGEDVCDGHECECGYTIDDVGEECYSHEALSHYIDDGEYQAECGQDGDIFITKSPYYTECNYCSPCAPGAGYLTDEGKDCHAYCFGPEHFIDRDGGVPHNIYRVSDYSLVIRKGEESDR